MKKRLLAAAAVLAFPGVALAQEQFPGQYETSAQETATAPDGSEAFGIEPYIGILGGYHTFDRDSEFGSTVDDSRVNGALISGIAGINVPLGPTFIGVEGNVAKGFSDIDWEYGVRGRLGARAGESGMVFASAGYQWIEAKDGFPNRSDWVYGVGVEVGPKDIGLGGITGNSGVRLRLQMETYDFDSLRPMGGVVFHF